MEQWIARHEESYHVNNFATAMAIDGSGNIYVTGYNPSFGGSVEFLTVKYDVAGVQQWTARYNRPGNYDARPIALAVDDAGNIYVAGYSRNGTYFDYATIKYDAAGTQKWVKTYNGPENNSDQVAALGIDAAGNIYVTGYSGSDYLTAKYNTTGVQQWTARYNGLGNEDDHAVALTVDDAGNIYVTGYSGHYGAYDYATVKYDSAGTQKWVATYNGPGNSDDRAEALVVDGANNVYVTGSIWNGTSYDYATSKYNSAGTQEWVVIYNGPGNDDDRATALAVDGVGNVYVTGYSGPYGAYNYATVKYNSAGEKQWVVHYGGPGYSSEAARALAIDGNSNVYVTGSGGTIKYNSAGKQEWIANSGVALAVDGDRNVYVTGSSYGSNTGYDYVTTKYIQIPIADAGPDKVICAGGSVPIGGGPTGSSGHGGPYTFSWTPSTGLNDPAAPNTIASPAKTTTYTVTVTETATGLSATDDVKITVLPQGGTGWSIAHIVDVDDMIFGINQSVAPRDNRGLALSLDEQYIYLSYNNPTNRRLVRKIKLSESDPANNHAAVVAQLDLGSGAPAQALATDDRGRVYLARPQKIWIYKSDLSSAPLHTIAGFTACEGVAITRENDKLVVFATDRTTRLLKRFELTETGDAITASTKTGLDGDGEVLIKDTINNFNAVSPRGLDVQSNGVIWVADIGAHRVFRFNPNGSSMASVGANKAMDVAIDEAHGEVYVSQYTLRKIKVFDLNGAFRRFISPAVANIDLDGENGQGALGGLDVSSCARVYVANEQGRSTLIGNPPDSPFSNVGDNNDIKAADTDPVLVVTGNAVAKESEAKASEVAKSEVVTSYELAQNYPNPFWSEATSRFAGNPSTTISFALPEAGKVTVSIYSEIGQLVRTLVDREMAAGRQQLSWNGRNQSGIAVAAGVYFYRMTVMGKNGEMAFTKTNRMTMVK